MVEQQAVNLSVIGSSPIWPFGNFTNLGKEKQNGNYRICYYRSCYWYWRIKAY